MIDKGLTPPPPAPVPVVGRLRKRHFTTFSSYISVALPRLQRASDAIPAAEAQAYYELFQPTLRRIAALWTVRALLGPCLESLILMDRWWYLREQLGDEAYVEIRPVFDKVESPRNMAVVAIKFMQGQDLN